MSYSYSTTEAGIRNKNNNVLTDKAKLSKGNHLSSRMYILELRTSYKKKEEASKISYDIEKLYGTSCILRTSYSYDIYLVLYM